MTASWLPQRQPDAGAVVLRDFPAGLAVRVACTRCSRFGKYQLPALIRRYGPAAGLPEVLAELSRDCQRRIDGQQADLCGAYFPGLGVKPAGREE